MFAENLNNIIMLALYILAGAAAIAVIFKDLAIIKRVHAVFLSAALASSLAALIIRAVLSGHAPFANHYESMLLMLFIFTAALFFFRFLKDDSKLVYIASPLSTVLALVTLQFYTEPSALIPVLRSIWLKIHVISTMISYALFLISFIFAVLYLIKHFKGNSSFSRMLPEKDFIDSVSYKLISAAHPLLSFGIISGAVWAQRAWGRYWGWDPKETWALITWLLYSAFLHIRISNKSKKASAAIINVIAFLSVIFTYFGVNFLLKSLHSYAK